MPCKVLSLLPHPELLNHSVNMAIYLQCSVSIVFLKNHPQEPDLQHHLCIVGRIWFLQQTPEEMHRSIVICFYLPLTKASTDSGL
jgi:hypothetical protein